MSDKWQWVASINHVVGEQKKRLRDIENINLSSHPAALYLADLFRGAGVSWLALLSGRVGSATMGHAGDQHGEAIDHILRRNGGVSGSGGLWRALRTRCIIAPARR